jgi:hypothetical protein
MFVLPNALFSAGYSLALSTAAGVALGLMLFAFLSSGFFVPEPPAGLPRFRWAEAFPARLQEARPELVEEYRRIPDPGLRLAARRLLGELRCAGEAAGRPEAQQSLELALLRFLASAPLPHPERRGELLAEQQGLEARLARAPEHLRAELQQALQDVGAALDRLDEAETLRVRLEERLGRCLQRLRAARRPQPEQAAPDVRAEQALGELIALERRLGPDASGPEP